MSPQDPEHEASTAVAASYVDALAEIEALLTKLEADNADVDALAADVARAAELISFCRERIHNAEERVQEIVVNLDGESEPLG